MTAIDSVPAQIVTFRVDERILGLDIGEVREIKGWQPETIMPEAPPHLRGVVDLRGTVVPVYDMRVVLGLSPTVATETHVIIVIETGRGVAALLADSVSDIVDVPEGALRPPPQIDGGKGLVKGLVVLDSAIVSLVDPLSIQVGERLFPLAA